MEITRRRLIAGAGATVVGGFTVTQLGGCGPGEDTIDSLDENPYEGPNDLISVTGKVTEARGAAFVMDDGTGRAIAGTRGEPFPSAGDCVTVEGEVRDCVGCAEGMHSIETWGFENHG